ncbi:MAG: heme-binding domain-containing protein [Saprospiraceae bacterium]|nr:heme-binding domain-containing protein [Saprospiraceae bacterium]
MLKKVFFGFLGLLAVAQFIRPSITNPAVNASLDFQQVSGAPSDVMQIMKTACYDCHSFETRYPWYSKVAPVSWWVANHINEGREHVNFSEFGKLNAEDRSEVFEESAETLQEGEMPLSSYTWFGMHPEAKLSDSDRNKLIAWFNAQSGEGGGEERDDK